MKNSDGMLADTGYKEENENCKHGPAFRRSSSLIKMVKLKLYFIVLLLLLSATVACDRNSSPEGRLQIRLETMEQKFDSLKIQNDAIPDSIHVLQTQLNTMKFRPK